jgi:hypothetical protein
MVKDSKLHYNLQAQDAILQAGEKDTSRERTETEESYKENTCEVQHHFQTSQISSDAEDTRNI